MKLIESTKTTATLEFSRTEFNDLSMMLGMCSAMLVGACDGVVQLTDAERKTGAAFVPKIQTLIQRWTRIAIENGWAEEADYE